jgi:DNA-binding transcriptional ArsR family regulator
MRTRPRSSHRDGEYWILDRDQIHCLVSAQRTDMVDRLAARGPMSMRELAAEIGMKPPALYRHLQKLLDVGLVVETGTRVVNRKQERLYATPSPRMRLIHALGDPRFRDQMVQLVATLGRQMARDFEHGIRRGDAQTQGPERNLGLFRLLGSPDAATLARINAHLDGIMELMLTQHDPRAPFIALTWTMTPVREKAANGAAPKRRARR